MPAMPWPRPWASSPPWWCSPPAAAKPTISPLKGAPAERLIVSGVEHPSVIAAAKASGKAVDVIPVDGNGVVDLAALEKLLPGKPALVSVMLANNETGVIQPLREIAALAHAHGALLHTDAVQALGKIPVNFGLLGADLMTLSAHKLGGPMGAGALVIRDGLAMSPLIHGGGQELRRRAGSENLAAIAGFAAVSAEKLHHINALRNELETSLEAATIFGKSRPNACPTPPASPTPACRPKPC